MSPNKEKQQELEQVLERKIEAWSPDESSALAHLEDADKVMMAQQPLKTRALLYVLCLVVISLLVWAGYAQIDEVTRGHGKVIPTRQIQIIQSQDGGEVLEIAVSEGDLVEKGQLLVKLDATRFMATFRENRSEILSLELRAERLRAITEGRDFVPSVELLKESPERVLQEIDLYNSTLQELESAKQIARGQISQRKQELVEVVARRNQLGRSLDFAQQELTATEPLAVSGAVSEVELLRLKREVSRLRGEREQASAQRQRIKASIREAEEKLSEVELEFKNNFREELSSTQARLNASQETSSGLSDRVTQTDIRSPVKGTVKQLFFNTIGGIVMPGREVIEVVPIDDALLLEAKVNPRDIAFLHPGQKAMVKFSAYDFVVYGGLEAVVEHIGADTVTDEEGNPFYIVRVRTLKSNMGEGKPIIPGMVAEVDILTGKKTILRYMLKPIFRAKHYAFSER